MLYNLAPLAEFYTRVAPAGSIEEPRSHEISTWEIDVLANRFGFDYTTMLGHRGLTHSFLFAMVLSRLVVLLFFRGPVNGTMNRLALCAFFFAATASHSVLDAMVDGTLGVAFLAPFSPPRFFLPWRPIVSSPIGLSFSVLRAPRLL
jgi:inner membrane protein